VIFEADETRVPGVQPFRERLGLALRAFWTVLCGRTFLYRLTLDFRDQKVRISDGAQLCRAWIWEAEPAPKKAAKKKAKKGGRK
jgi:hypothetical protein